VVSSSQLAAGDFPPVCVMTGAPAETWRKFRFSTPPAWAIVFIFLVCVGGLGFLVTIPLTYLVGRHASGTLPLTRASVRRLGLLMRIGILLTVVGLVLLLIAVTVVTRNPLVGILFVVSFDFGALALAFGVPLVEVGLQMEWPLIGSRAKVMRRQPGQTDRFIELQGVHPAFMTAVREIQQARGAPPFSQLSGSI
jgi:hypothetical protein